MNKRTSKRRVTRPKATTRPKTTRRKKKASLEGFKQKLNLVIIWSLVVVNGVLIYSLIHKLIFMQPNIQYEASTEIIENPITFEILNGCGVPGIANQFSKIVQRFGHDVRIVGNAEEFGYEKTVLIDRGKRTEKEIKKVREELGLSAKRVLQIKAKGYSTDVTLILGSDYANLKSYKEVNF